MLAAAAQASAQPVSFTDPTDFGVGANPRSVAVGDFNGDSDPDLAIANGGTAGSVSILLGAAGGSFTGPTSFDVGADPSSVAVGDFNGDSDPDLAVAKFTFPGGVSILLGGAGGSFTGPTNFAAGASPASVAVGDFNGDSDPDLAVANYSVPGTVSILLGSAGGSFMGPTNFAAGARSASVAVGDFNGDSDPDLAVAKFTLPGGVSILLGGAGGSFTGPTSFDVGSLPQSVAVSDFNADSDPDLAVANTHSNSVSILLGAAGGSFTGPTNFGVGSDPRSVAVGDFNHDSDPDLAVANSETGDVSVLLGGAGGSFGVATDFAAGSSPFSVAVGDFNRDTDPDLAVANLNSGNVSILLNLISAPAAPQLTDTDPHSPANQNQLRVKGTAATGSTVRLYRASTTRGCTPENLVANATGTAADFASPGLRASVPDNSSTIFRATATDAAEHTSACSPSSINYVEDSDAPAPPSLTVTDPASPSQENFPRVKGTAEADSKVSLYSAPAARNCTPANLIGTGTAAELASTGVRVSVPENLSTTLRGRATDLAGNTSACSAPVDYVEDSAAPAPPSLTDTDPESPANDRSPVVKGTAEAGSTVRLYKASTAAECTAQNLAATGTAAEFASPGLAASVPDNSTTSFRATATDAAGNTSGCSSSSIIYVEDSRGFPVGGVGSALSAPSLVAADRAAPRLTLGGASSQRIGSRGKVYVLVECDEACTVSASATASVRQASKVFRTGKVSHSLAAGKRARLGLRFSKQGTRAIRRALARHKRLTARVAVTARDRAGNASSSRRKIRLTQ